MSTTRFEPELACLTQAYFSPLPYEVDFTGFLSNTVAATWLERLRIQIMAEHFSDLDIYAPQNLSVIARTQIDYLRPVRLIDCLEARAHVARCLSASWTIQFSFRHTITGQEHLRATQVGVFLNPVNLTPIRMPPQIRQRVAAL